MQEYQRERLTGAELYALFDDLFPHGFSGADVLAEIAPDGWERSPLPRCFHPSAERVFEEQLQIHRNIGQLRSMRPGSRREDDEPPPEPTLDDVRREYKPQPMRADQELTDLVGLCLWDIFSDNHDVIAADGRAADIGSFRGAGAFLDEYLGRGHDSWREGDYLRFYMGTIWVGARADLTPVYAMIFRRLKAIAGNWIYHFPELGLVDLTPLRTESESTVTGYSVSEGAVAELRAQQRGAEVRRLRAELTDLNARAREEAMDRPPPSIVRAYRQVYGCDPRGWPPE